jgi:hypothetical protein
VTLLLDLADRVLYVNWIELIDMTANGDSSNIQELIDDSIISVHDSTQQVETFGNDEIQCWAYTLHSGGQKSESSQYAFAFYWYIFIQYRFSIIAFLKKLSVFKDCPLYNKQKNTWVLGNTIFISRVEHDIPLIRCAHSWDIMFNTRNKSGISKHPCFILYILY